ncbi:hypothetical protein PR003_g16533 [Phytophthora rubi]|uniref:Uncharacterized protein n=1 Tax=Phytophthora rubi TaxID=129364 RepID=A0A6A3IMF3_9STRA|nr:hypothetical protein PR001_g23878 [Phytophthora rubi]KAE9005937.1 hypothetical protein PR002_g16618 [Phytophthora rubi]KAE9325224.1 hypothetical protein PR003_g16533 [Phytophthora rubi]
MGACVPTLRSGASGLSFVSSWLDTVGQVDACPAWHPQRAVHVLLDSVPMDSIRHACQQSSAGQLID